MTKAVRYKPPPPPTVLTEQQRRVLADITGEPSLANQTAATVAEQEFLRRWGGK